MTESMELKLSTRFIVEELWDNRAHLIDMDGDSERRCVVQIHRKSNREKTKMSSLRNYGCNEFPASRYFIFEMDSLCF